MERIRHIRLSGHAEAVALTSAAQERLLRSLADGRSALASDPDADETIRDLEGTLGEQMHQLLAATGTPLDDTQMRRLLTDAGAVESQHPVATATPGQERGPFWCRIHEGRWFGGLCLGISARGEFRVDWVRTIAIVLTLVTGGLLGVAYLALLLVVPRVETVQEYRRLRDAPRAVPPPRR